MTSEGAERPPSAAARIPGKCYCNHAGSCIGPLRTTYDGKLLDHNGHLYFKDGRSLGSVYENYKDWDLTETECPCKGERKP